MDKELSQRVYEEFLTLPEGEKIASCIQCGTCSGSCPVANIMDFTPRRAIGMLKSGDIDEVLKADTAWVCASCYSCTARCPSEIKITDFMYHLKRTAEKHGIKPRKRAGLKLAKNFNKVVAEYGRSYEPELMIRQNIPNVFNFIKIAPLGMMLFIKKRMPYFPKKIKGAKHIKKALKNLEA
ncbi:MAG: 4Fe-4S dicluster domain-containing protein [Candidatus Goldiibacteriota bacterium]